MVWMMIAAVCAFFIKGVSGFANSLIFSAILSFTTDNINITPIELLLGFPSNIVLSIRERKRINLRICVPLAMLVLIGSVPGIFILKNMDAGIIKVAFGFAVILLGIEMLLRESRPKKKPESKLVLLAIGIIAGLLCGIYGIGALMAAYVSRVTKDTASFRAYMCFIFLIENSFRIVVYIILGILNLGVVKDTLIILPFMALGLFLGIKSSSHMNDKLIKKIVIIMLMLSGVALIISNI